jgi:hypothetical protein
MVARERDVVVTVLGLRALFDGLPDAIDRIRISARYPDFENPGRRDGSVYALVADGTDVTADPALTGLLDRFDPAGGGFRADGSGRPELDAFMQRLTVWQPEILRAGQTGAWYSVGCDDTAMPGRVFHMIILRDTVAGAGDARSAPVGSAQIWQDGNTAVAESGAALPV